MRTTWRRSHRPMLAARRPRARHGKRTAFPINVRYPREVRDSVEQLRGLPVLTGRGAQIRLGDVATIRIEDGPSMLKSENARLSGWVYVDIRGRDLSSAVHAMQQVVAKEVKLPPGYSVSWSGQFEYLERATTKLKAVVPVTLLIIFVLLYLTFKRFDEAALIMATLPFALAGGVWLLWLLGYNLSVASGVGFIALAGVAAEFGVIMLLYSKKRVGSACRVRTRSRSRPARGDPRRGGAEGAAQGHDGGRHHRRLVPVMVGGMVTAPLLSMFVMPAAYLLLRRRQLRHVRMAVAVAAEEARHGT